MSILTSEERKRLPRGRFGLPAMRTYPIPDAAHARNALARAAQDATPAERAEIERNVHRLYPRIKIGK
ncbi:MAG TPA: hypothetical protein VMV31_02755 [Terriglobales bacterium]|nr:hypothetical protein [Terriglobales bacterium]